MIFPWHKIFLCFFLHYTVCNRICLFPMATLCQGLFYEKEVYCGVFAVLAREPSILHDNISLRYMSVIISYSKFAFTKGQNTLGDISCCSDMLQWQVAATNHFVCTEEFLWKFCSPQKNFVVATSCKKVNHTEFVQRVAAAKLCCGDKDLGKNSPVHMKWFVTAICHQDMLLLLVRQPVLNEWFVTAIYCCSLQSTVYQP